MKHHYWIRLICLCVATLGLALTAAANQVPDATEIQAIRRLYADTNGAGWVDNTNWMQGSTIADVATWAGVTVTNGDITGLALSQNQLSGPFSTALGDLTALEQLDLSGNQLTGIIPTGIGQLVNLQYLNLSANQFTGGIPSALGQLSSLQTLILSYNQFSRALPIVLGQLTALQTLDVKSNLFTGSIPSALSQLANLTYIDVSDNNLTGTLPGIVTQWAGITYLDCSNNQLTGQLPAGLTQLTSLQLLKISYNQFSGELPALLGQLVNLYYLDASFNQLSGALPASTGQLTALQYLYLDHNQFSGSLPASAGQWTNLVELVLSDNQFTGTLPTAMAQWGNLVYVQANNNRFSGSVPTGLAQLPNLQYLLLSNNLLGALPDFSSNVGLTLEVANNQLEFGSLEPNFTGIGVYNFPSFQYAGQVLPTTEVAVEARIGQPFTLPSSIGGAQTHYQWQRQIAGNWQNISATAATYQASSAVAADAGLYRCVAVNDWVTGITLYSRPVRLTLGKPLPPSDPSDDLNRNWAFSRSFDLAGTITGESKQFTDGLGRPTQSQSKNLAEHHVFASQTLNNTNGVAVLSTLSAPTNNQEFKYKTDFITATTTPSGGGAPVSSPYSAANFEKATNALVATDPLDETSPGTLGYYYSTNNAWEPAVAATHNPFAIQEPMPGPLGGTRRAAGPGDEYRLGTNRQMQSREFSLLNEMDHYSQLRPRFVAGSATTSLRGQGSKSVSISSDGVETIAFADRTGQILARCLSGDQYPASTITGTIDADPNNSNSLPTYQDIHIPQSTSVTTIAVTDANVGGTCAYSIINLAENPQVPDNHTGSLTTTLAPGFYRLLVTQGRLGFSYQVHYGNFSYLYYDDAGHNIASIAPKGMNELLPNGWDNGLNAVPNFVSRSTFNSLGEVLSNTSVDEGISRFVYARDGRLRFSQSALQAQANPSRFSYITYDNLGRPIESGEYTPDAAGPVFEDMSTVAPATNSVLQDAVLEDKSTSGGLVVARCSQRKQIWYDVAQPDAALGNRQQDFVLGAVAKTSNGTTTSWYSYNELGQLTWMVQQAPVVGVKTVDYTYDMAGNITQVAYQQGQPDAFYHHNTYDENQRLLTVSTSTDGVTQMLQARYLYYLHGPLKRVETAGNLQGTDYTYTVQGWLKGINSANRSLTTDNPTVNSFAKDLFGITLDYFSGDYRSSQASLASPTISGGPVLHYDGTVRSAAWFTAASPTTMRQHVYTYDAKGQLSQSTFGQLIPGATPTAAGTFVPAAMQAYEEGNLSYDANGNIGSLRRRDGSGTITDNFTYQYPTGANKLTAVNNPAGAAVLDYDYDATGQMTRQRDEQGQHYLTYNLTGKVTGVFRDAARQQPLVLFTYDDRGFRASKASYDPTTFQLKRTTYYVRDANGLEISIYGQEVASGSTLLQIEVPLYGNARLGTRTRLDDGSLDYRYELNDHLGNARVVYHKPTSATYTATMEPAAASQEQRNFNNVSTTRFTAPGYGSSATVARLGMQSGHQVGPSKTLVVEKGDTITFRAYAKLAAAVVARTSSPRTLSHQLLPLFGLSVPLAAPVSPRPAGQETNSPNTLPRMSVGVALPLVAQATRTPASQQRSSTGGYGNAQLHYIIRDQNGNILDEDIQSAAPQNPGVWQELRLGLRLSQGGTVELSVESDGLTGPDVFFDDIQIEHTTGTIVQEQHSYAYGSPMTGLNYVVGNKSYRNGYQGQFTEKDPETGWDNFDLRMYDSRIGRWTAPDLAGQYDSPYLGMGNEPVTSVDPDGALSINWAALWGQFKSAIGLGRMVGTGVAQNLMYVAEPNAVWLGVGNAASSAASAAASGAAAAAPYLAIMASAATNNIPQGQGHVREISSSAVRNSIDYTKNVQSRVMNFADAFKTGDFIKGSSLADLTGSPDIDAALQQVDRLTRTSKGFVISTKTGKEITMNSPLGKVTISNNATIELVQTKAGLKVKVKGVRKNIAFGASVGIPDVEFDGDVLKVLHVPIKLKPHYDKKK